MSEARPLTVALAGNPNAGKTALFNRLTGAKARVANYPGTTVERREAHVNVGGLQLTVLDIPGTYSLAARSKDEEIAHDALTGRLGTPRADLVIAVVDVTRLSRSLYLTLQLLEQGLPVVVALNLMDEAERKGLVVHPEILAQRLGVPVIPTVATEGQGLDQLLAAALALAKAPAQPDAQRAIALPLTPDDQAIVDAAREALSADGAAASDGDALFYLTSGGGLRGRLPDATRGALDALATRAQGAGASSFAQRVIAARYQRIGELSAGVVVPSGGARGPDRSRRIDRVLTHPVGGLALFGLTMLVLFQAIYGWSQPLIEGVETLVGGLGDWTSAHLPEGALRDLLVDGLIAGVGNVLVFVPQLVLLFVGMAVLEDSGYMARAAFLMDRLMGKVGLQGRAFLPLLTSFACAIPGIAAARTIEGHRDRLVTMLMAPFMSCSARLPVYTMVVGAVFANSPSVAGLSFGGLVVTGMYVLGIVGAFLSAWLLKKTALRSAPNAFLIELPDYRRPRLRSVWLYVYRQTRAFVTQTGAVIVLLSIVLWAAMTYPKASLPDAARAAAEASAPDAPEEAVAHAEAQHQLAHSTAGRIGHAIEPLIAPLGFDWKIGIGLVGSFAAREVLVSTLGQVYGVGADANEGSVVLREALLAERDPVSGKPVFTPAVGLALMAFFSLAMQCLATVAALRRETGTWRWPLASIVWMNGLAWVAAFVTYRVSMWAGL